MIDIEELTIESANRSDPFSEYAVPNNRFILNGNACNDQEADSHVPFLPGQAAIFVKTWGCGHNNSDGEYMAGLLAADGYTIVLNDAEKNKADLWLLNSCTVKGPSEQTFINEIQKAVQQGKKIVVSGCVPQGSPKGQQWNALSIIGVQQIDQVVYVVEETLKGNTVQLLKDHKSLDKNGKMKKTGGASLMLPKIRRNPYIEIIPINTGCLNQCTYCKTKHARGDLGSYTIKEITDRVAAVMEEGVQEIWLTSEDTGAYGRDIGVSIVELLREIIRVMENHANQDTMLRIGMTNPPYILEHLPDMAPILNHDRVYAFLHVPFQAGSNRVLNDMRRLYVREDFIQVVEYLRDNVSGITIATDVICGFPTETDDDFEETLDLLNIYRFPALHISQFYPRPGTPAARLQKLPSEVVKSRSRKVTKLFESYLSYEDLIGMDLDVLVTDRASDSTHYMAHDKNYRPILIPANEDYMGKWINVKIVETGKYFIKSEFNSFVSGKGSISASSSKKIPKLIRGQKGMIKMSDSSENAVCDDGTHLSIPKNVPKSLRNLIFSRNRLNALSASCLTTFLLSRVPMRWSLKLGISFLMFLGVYQYDENKKLFMV